MIRKFAATACLSAAIVASLAGGASAKGSTWAVVHGTVYVVTMQPSGSTWALTPVKKGAVPAGVKWNVPPAAERKFGVTSVAGASMAVPSSIKLN